MNTIVSNEVIHPYMEDSKMSIIREVVRADGIHLYDVDGKKYIDGIGGLWNVVLGYNQSEIATSIFKQMERVPFVNLRSNTHETLYELANKLLEKTDNNSQKLMYTTTGSEAIELAMKFSRQYFHKQGLTDKKYIVGLDISYHGTTYGALSVTGVYHKYTDELFPGVGGIALIRTPNYEDSNEEEYVNYLIEFFEKNHHRMAGIVIEPISGVGGILKFRDLYMQTIYELCQKYSVLLIIDEVTTGFYRTGEFFSYQSYQGIYPDIVCVSKAITNGYLPLGAVLLGKRIVDKFTEHGFIPHYTTQNGNPVCCAAALKVLEILDRENYQSKNIRTGNQFHKYLEEGLALIPSVQKIRSEGMMFAVELRNERGDIIDFDQIWDTTEALKENGLIVYPYSTYKTSGVIMMPPYILTEENMKSIAEILSQTLYAINYD